MKVRHVILAMVFCAGCVASAPVPDRTNPAPAVETIFTVLADRAAAHPDRYPTTDDLVRVVAKLEEGGDISPAQAAAVKAKLGTTRRELTPQDIDAIRGL